MTTCTALIVDDNPIDRLLLERELELLSSPIAIMATVDGEDAIAYLEKHHLRDDIDAPNRKPQPLIIFLDVHMPVMGGLEFLQEFEKRREAMSGRSAVIMMMSSAYDPNVFRQTQRYDFVSGILPKEKIDPFHLEAALNAAHKTAKHLA